jgi:hypothetical protein
MVKGYGIAIIAFLVCISFPALALPETGSELKKLCEEEISSNEQQECSMLIGYQLVMLYNPSSERGSKYEMCEDLTSKIMANKFVEYLNSNPKLEGEHVFSVLKNFFEQEIMCST